jgi:excisionase family DNA binding protein
MTFRTRPHDAGGCWRKPMHRRTINEVHEAYSVADACKIGGFGKSTFYKVVNERRLRVRKLGSKTLVLRSDLLEFLKALPTVTE